MYVEKLLFLVFLNKNGYSFIHFCLVPFYTQKKRHKIAKKTIDKSRVRDL